VVEMGNVAKGEGVWPWSEKDGRGENRRGKSRCRRADEEGG